MTTALKGTLLQHESLARYTSWRVGGPASTLYKAHDLQDLQQFLRQLPESEQLFWLGLGSNILVRDGGILGTVIITQGALKKIEQLTSTTVRAEAGVSSAQLARYCTRQGLHNLEFLVGIPGTIGGALAMNAGCSGDETWPHVKYVEVIDRHGNITQVTPQELKIEYRHVSGLQDQWFVAGVFELTPGDKEISRAKIHECLNWRKDTQPINEPSCGSVFRNPPGDHAARLIEVSGLKGTKIGGAMVSEKHANFILNRENATAADIESLIEYIGLQVKEKHGIDLIREVHIVGEYAKTDISLD